MRRHEALTTVLSWRVRHAAIFCSKWCRPCGNWMLSPTEKGLVWRQTIWWTTSLSYHYGNQSGPDENCSHIMKSWFVYDELGDYHFQPTVNCSWRLHCTVSHPSSTTHWGEKSMRRLSPGRQSVLGLECSVPRRCAYCHLLSPPNLPPTTLLSCSWLLGQWP